MTSNLLEARSVSKHFTLQAKSFVGQRKQAVIRAVDDVTFTVAEGETVAMVGESGCGKTTLMRLLLRLIDPTTGSIYFMNQETTNLKGRRLNKLRRNMQIVFQDPLSSLDPSMAVYSILAEPLTAHSDLKGRALQERVKELLELVGLAPDHLWRRPHEFSGGQCQRIAIARAIALNPSLLILDEPTASLDVSVQALILRLLGELQKSLGLTYIFVTHNLSVAKCVADRLFVMYLGIIVEMGPIKEVFERPLHPYTRLLLRSVPSPVPGDKLCYDGLLEGGIPSPVDLPPGCRFHPRCPDRMPRCSEMAPPFRAVSKDRQIACWNV